MNVLRAALLALLALTGAAQAQYKQQGLPLSGGNLSGPLSLSPGTVTYANDGYSPNKTSILDVANEYNGVCSANCTANLMRILRWDVQGTEGSQSGINTSVRSIMGGANQRGGFINFDATLRVDSTTGNLTNQFYQAANIYARAEANDNGTLGATKGSLFASGLYAILATGATNWHAVNAQENDISIQTGASADFAGGQSVVLLSDNAVAANLENFGFMLSAQSGAVPTIDCGYCFGGRQGVNPLGSSASLMAFRPNGGSGAGPTITNGIDLTKFTFTGAAFGSTGWSVDGSGNVTGASFTAGTASATLKATGAGAQTITLGDVAAHNVLQLTSTATGSNPTLQVAGVDANRSLLIKAAGTSTVQLGNATNGISFRANDGGVAMVNYVLAQGTASGGGPLVSVDGTDSVINMTLRSKGTGSSVQSQSPTSILPGTITYAGAGSLDGNTSLRSFTSTYNGTCSSACVSNLLQINSYNVNQTGQSGINTRVYTNLGGTNFKGGYLNFDTTLFINSATGNITNQFYQAGNIASIAAVNDGGGVGTEQGSNFALGTYAVLRTGATNWLQNINTEDDISIQTGANALYAGGHSVVLLSDNAVAATRENFGFLISAQSGAVPTIDCGFCLGGYQGLNPFSSGAALMAFRPHAGVGSGPTILNGIDLTKFTFTGKAFSTTGWSVDGSGNAAALSLATATINGATVGGTMTIGTSGSTENGIQIVPGATNNPAVIQGVGVDSNVALRVYAAGTAAAELGSSSRGSALRASVDSGGTVNNTNVFDFHGTGTGTNVAYVSTLGVDTNIDYQWRCKGTTCKSEFSPNGSSPVLSLRQAASYQNGLTLTSSANGSPVSITTNTNDAETPDLKVSALGNVIIGTGSALATTATLGLAKLPTMAGAPTGIVGATGQAAFVIDTTNKKLCYSIGGGTWECSAAFTP